MADIKWPRSFRGATALPADQVGAIVEALIAELDRRAGDIEAEPGTWTEDLALRRRKGVIGDDHEEHGLEDGYLTFKARGAGCPISDPDYGADDQGEPQGWER